MKEMKNPFRKPALVGIVVALISLLMIIFGAPPSQSINMPNGFSTPILALEFARNQEVIDQLLESLTKADKRALVNAVWLDMGFMVAYNLFLYLILITIGKIIRKPLYAKIALMTSLILLADFFENIQILQVLNGREISIFLLQVSTWLKWLLLAYLILVVGRFLMTTGRVYDRILGLACFIPLPVGILAFFSPQGMMNELFAGLFFLIFPMMIIYTWFSGIKKIEH